MTKNIEVDGIAASGIYKKFCTSLNRILFYGIQDVAYSVLGLNLNYSRLRKDEFWAINNVNLQVTRGEVLGIIGPNGCGKTTLLRLLAGIIPIDKGVIATRGRVSTLITLGAGFHPHMSVLENIYLNGTILGMGKDEISEKLSWIIDFSGLKNSLKTPVAILSSGMRVRLGFSIALSVQPEVLLIDEVLAVGDRKFREKCVKEISKISKSCAIVFVSHNMDYVEQVCTKLAIMKNGQIIGNYSNVSKGIQDYFL